MLAIIYLILGFLPPLAAGPLAGLVYITILKRGKGWQQVLFWVLLAALDFLVVFFVIQAPGRWLPVASLPAFFFTPVAAILTVFVMRRAWRKTGAGEDASPSLKRRFIAGLVYIPALQLGSFLALIRYVPWLCQVGWMACNPF
jgi:hypothetical protein